METKRKKGVAPPRYDEAFKARAIRMVTEQGRPSTGALRNWASALTRCAVG